MDEIGFGKYRATRCNAGTRGGVCKRQLAELFGIPQVETSCLLVQKRTGTGGTGGAAAAAEIPAVFTQAPLAQLLGLGVLSKLNYLLFFVSLLLALASLDRCKLLRPGLLLSLFIGLLIASPYLVWLLDSLDDEAAEEADA